MDEFALAQDVIGIQKTNLVPTDHHAALVKGIGYTSVGNRFKPNF